MPGHNDVPVNILFHRVPLVLNAYDTELGVNHYHNLWICEYPYSYRKISCGHSMLQDAQKNLVKTG